MIKSRRMRWAENVARMGEKRGASMASLRRPRKGYHFENLGVERSIILKWIFKKLNEEDWTVFIWLKNIWRTRVNVVMNF
jgi:hypothetical protein